MARRKHETVTYERNGVMVTEAKRSRTRGTIRRLGSGKYQAIYRAKGKRYYSRAMETESEAEAFLRRTYAAIDLGQWKPPTVIQAETFGKYAGTWVNQRVTRGHEPLRPKTKTEYLRQLDDGLSGFSSMPLDSITASVIRSWFADRCKKAGVSAASGEARLLHAVLATAQTDGVVERNECPSELLKMHSGKRFRNPTPEELTAIIAKLPAKWRLAVYLQAFGGLRFGEWIALRRSDLSEADGHVAVDVSKQAQRVGGKWRVGEPKSREGIRLITLPKWLTPVVNVHLKDHVGDFPASLIFQPRNGAEFMSESTWSHMWHRALTGAKIDESEGTIRPHDLRHFFGSTLAASGLGIRQIQGALGHGTAQASLAYLSEVHGMPESTADILKPLPKPVKPHVVRLRRKA